MSFSISTKGRYAVLMMFQLAQGGNNLTSLAEISSTQNISYGYLEQIVKPLRDHNLVESKRGFGGGYKLAKPASQITIGDIITIVEGPVAPVKCAMEDFSSCKGPPDCKAKLVWREVTTAINDVLHSITLQDLLEDTDEIENLKGEKSHEHSLQRP
ncbi:MAG TPA: Rrf2 family transcriptional regulator [Bacillota bacterium]|nr:Rrf2 family transcriptional regulator [Bacillota bacterium]HOK64171.1 Rrf2 family transcriptional regulator [Bacillota bacterium]HOL11680.1 Rrf2 family transcriptional regulator [Bacillota bacterium]HOQ02808.1 Rrf2 family transcriptional regulator [Bacillota bacterium]HPP60424.1 Rrf2 family transcriptional regulator [Bacillota bacterium]